MDHPLAPGAGILGLWLLFGGTHIALASHPLRERLVERLGRWGFTGVFYVVAATTFAALIHHYANVRLEGAAGLGLATGTLGWIFGGVNLFAMALVGAALVGYSRSAHAFSNAEASAPRGLETITRHGFFVGLALLGISHALLAPRLVGAVFMAGMAAFTLIGAAHQDRKLLRQRGQPYRDFLENTSTLPFLAIARGRAALRPGELPWLGLGLGVGLGLLARGGHGRLFTDGGLWVIAAVVGGALNFALVEYLRERRALRQARLVAS